MKPSALTPAGSLIFSFIADLRRLNGVPGQTLKTSMLPDAIEKSAHELVAENKALWEKCAPEPLTLSLGEPVACAAGENVLLIRCNKQAVTPANSLSIPAELKTCSGASALHQQPIFIDRHDLVFLSEDGSSEILRLDLKRLFNAGFLRARIQAVGLPTSLQLQLAECVMNKAAELDIGGLSQEDWNGIFSVMSRPAVY